MRANYNFSSLRRLYFSDSMGAGLIRNKIVLANIGVRGIAAVLALIAQVALVKLLGEGVYGGYVLFITVCSLIFIFSRSGLDVIVLRRASVAYSLGYKGALIALAKRSVGLCVIFSAGWTFAFTLLQGVLSSKSSLEIPHIDTAWVFSGVASMTVLAILISVGRGLRKIILADAIDTIIKPVMVLAVVAISVWFYVASSIRVAMFAFVAANIIATLAVIIAVRHRMKQHSWSATERIDYQRTISAKEGATFIALGLITYTFFQLDTLLVGAQLGNESVAAYNMACNFVRLVIFVPMVIVVQMQPLIASACQTGDIRGIRSTVVSALKKSIFFAVCAVLALVLFGHWLLGLVSESFTDVYLTLVVLAVAHLINSAVLVLSGALLMCKEQKLVVAAQLAGLSVCGPLYLVLIPLFGTIGAATSVLFGLSANLACLAWLMTRWIQKDRPA